MPNDYGYFGKGTEGYIHYKKTFDRTYGSGGGGNRHNRNNNTGCFPLVCIAALIVFLILL